VTGPGRSLIAQFPIFRSGRKAQGGKEGIEINALYFLTDAARQSLESPVSEGLGEKKQLKKSGTVDASEV